MLLSRELFTSFTVKLHNVAVFSMKSDLLLFHRIFFHNLEYDRLKFCSVDFMGSVGFILQIHNDLVWLNCVLCNMHSTFALTYMGICKLIV